MTRQRWARRTAACLGLLLIPAACNWLPYLLPRNPWLRQICWGFACHGSILAVWMVTRRDLLTSAAGWLRMAAYVLAANVGWVLAIAWNRAPDPTIVPGSESIHFGLAIFLSHSMVAMCWLTITINVLTRRQLVEAGQPSTSLGSPLSVRALMAWTAVAAIWVASFHLLRRYGQPFHLAIANPELDHDMTDAVLGAIPIQAVQILTVMTVFAAFASGAARCLFLLTMAGAILGLGMVGVHWIGEYTDTVPYFGASFVDAPFSPQFIGYYLLLLFVCGTSRVLGLHFMPTQRREPAP